MARSSKPTARRTPSPSKTPFVSAPRPFNTALTGSLPRRLPEQKNGLPRLKPQSRLPQHDSPCQQSRQKPAREAWFSGPDLLHHRGRLLCAGENSDQCRSGKNGGHFRPVDHHPHRHQAAARSEEHTSELQSRLHLVCRLLLEKK